MLPASGGLGGSPLGHLVHVYVRVCECVLCKASALSDCVSVDQ